jgi:SAM-dependent methyltransferase
MTYRSRGVKDYWRQRWASIPADQPMENQNAYPLKHAEMTVAAEGGPILEAGCGAGRVLRYYHDRGYEIVGMDYVEVAVEKLKAIDPSLKVEVGDITQLRYADGTFRIVLAFGLYHNLDAGLERAVAETSRVLQHNGRVCASLRADNFQTRLSDWLEARREKTRGYNEGPRLFHKLNLTRGETESLFRRAGFEIDAVYPVENMPLLYKFAPFRAPDHKEFNENKARKEGYRLSWWGKIMQRCLMRLFPDQLCNIYVLIAHKPG